MGHETLWFPQDIGEAATPGHRPPWARTELERGCTSGAGVGGSGVPVATGVGAGWRGGLGSQAGARQVEPLQQRLLKGAKAYGFPNELWTLKRIATVIWLEFRVRYHPSHVWKVLRSWRWSCQVPERRAIQRDEQAIAHWKRCKWPAIKKSPTTWRPPRVP
jgi:hypothetical protein